MEALEKNIEIILFDGVCNLCNGAIQFIIKKDKKRVFRYASLQSDLGKKLLKERKINPKETDSIILIKPNETYYTKSSAALHISKKLNHITAILSVFLIFPKFLRDPVYDFIAKNRYRWFGKKEACMLPTPELKKLFLDS